MGDISLKIKSGDYVKEYQDNDFAIASVFKESKDEMSDVFVDIRGEISASRFYCAICEMYKGVLTSIPEKAVPEFMSAMHEAVKDVEVLFNTKLEITLVKKDDTNGGDSKPKVTLVKKDDTNGGDSKPKVTLVKKDDTNGGD